MTHEVSILLVQWITLEAHCRPRRRANPIWFQSFWFNGLLWKVRSACILVGCKAVSILLVQWITLEGASLVVFFL